MVKMKNQEKDDIMQGVQRQSARNYWFLPPLLKLA